MKTNGKTNEIYLPGKYFFYGNGRVEGNTVKGEDAYVISGTGLNQIGSVREIEICIISKRQEARHYTSLLNEGLLNPAELVSLLSFEEAA